MATLTSTNMLMPVPVVSQEPGPQFAIDINDCLTIVDGHDHTTGSGVPVPSSGININADLGFNNFNLTGTRTLRLQTQGSAPATASDLGILYRLGVDLYYKDGSGNAVRITQSGGVAGSPGSISNLTSPASASYVGGSTTFVWQSDSNTPAYMDCSSVLIRNLVANSKALTLAAPNAMSADYTLVLPSLPASQKIMTLDASGNISAPYSVDSSTIVISSNVIQVPNGGITSAKIQTNVDLPGTYARSNGLNLVSSNTNASAALSVVRLVINSSGTITSGEGAVITKNSTGNFTVNYTAVFLDAPSIFALALNNTNPITCTYTSNSASGVIIHMWDVAASPYDTNWSFFAIGQRA